MLKNILYNSKLLDGLFTESDFAFLNSADNEISDLNQNLEKQKRKREQIIDLLNDFKDDQYSSQNFNNVVEAKEIFELINTNIKNIYRLQEEFQQLEKSIVEFIVDFENNNYIGNTAVADIKYRVNSYSNLYKDVVNNISLNDFKIDNFFVRANIKVATPIIEKKVEINIPVFNKELPTDIEDNLTLIISETKKKVFLPYTRDEILEYMKKYPNDYSSSRDVIKQEFISPISIYSKHPVLARFRESYSLIRDREMKSIMEAFKYSIDLMFKYELNPAIIAACKSEKQLNDYLHCLETNTLDNFKHFSIKFEVTPLSTKNNNLF